MGTSRRAISMAGIILSILGLCWLLIPGHSQPAPVSWDDVIYESGADSSVYRANIDMELTGSTLTVKLQNVSTGDAGESSADLLTGLGFDLPTGISILGGTAMLDRLFPGDPAVTGAYSIGPADFILSEGQFVSGEWGWGQGIGQFNTVVPGMVDWDISCMQASTASAFSPTSLAPPSGLDGPEFGLLSRSLSPSEAGGLNYIQDALTFELDLGGDLSGWTSGDLIDFIDDGDVIIAFGSPTTIPDASTLFLLGSACLAGFAISRKRSAR